jgi:DNA polymerase-4
MRRLPGVGKVTEEKLKGLDVHTIADLRLIDLSALESRFGRYGVRLYELARGADENKVMPDRLTQSISTGRYVRTRGVTPRDGAHDPQTRRTDLGRIAQRSCEEVTAIAHSLGERVGFGPQQRFRLVGVGVSNFVDPEDISAQSALFGRVSSYSLPLMT